MKRDIETRKDIEEILNTFYKQAFQDELIGHFFTEVVPLDLNIHIPVIADFWEGILFNVHKYGKNVMKIHQQISDLSPIHKVHLDRWVTLFTATITSLFEGPKAELMKQRAKSIATLMDIKINHST
ncbi:MAG: group III truncated hemoglobin [Flavisolibacter sp.]